MNWIDILLVLIGVFSIWSGWRKGFIHAAADLLVRVGSVVIAFFLYPYVARLGDKLSPMSPWILPVSFLLSLILAGFLLSWLARRLLVNVSRKQTDTQLNHILGIFPGAADGFITMCLVSLILSALPLSDGISNAVEKSTLAAELTPKAEWVQDKLAPVFEEAVKRSMTKMTVDPHSSETIRLPFRDSTIKERPDLEAEMLILVNKERIENGLQPLTADTAMRRVAIAHSRDMFARGFFSHNTPEGKTPFDRIKAARIRFLAAGENLAFARTLSIAHTGLMNSPGHRANILSPAFGRVGIGIADGGVHGLVISQEFRN